MGKDAVIIEKKFASSDHGEGQVERQVGEYLDEAFDVPYSGDWGECMELADLAPEGRVHRQFREHRQCALWVADVEDRRLPCLLQDIVDRRIEIVPGHVVPTGKGVYNQRGSHLKCQNFLSDGSKDTCRRE